MSYLHVHITNYHTFIGSWFFQQAVIDADIITPLVVLLRTSETDIKKEAAWAISNAASSGSSDQIQYVLACGHLNLSSVFWHTELNMVICNDCVPAGIWSAGDV